MSTMRKRTTYQMGPDVSVTEVLRDRQGRLVDNDYVRQAAEDALREARRRGRPSLPKKGEAPLLRIRLPQELDDAIGRAAKRTGKSRAEWVRKVLDEASRNAN